MKRLFCFPPILVAILLTGSCNKFDQLTIFDMAYRNTVVIPASTAVNLPFNLYSPEITSNSEETFEVNDTRKDHIDKIRLKKMNLKITSPQNGNFNFLNSISIFINADGLTEKHISWKNPVSADSSQILELALSGEDLQPYIINDKFKLRINTVTDEILSNNYTIDLDAIFEVNARIRKR